MLLQVKKSIEAGKIHLFLKCKVQVANTWM